MAKITTLLLVLFSLVASAQQEASLNHYQRFLVIDSMPLPFSDFDKGNLSIAVPDSLYSAGNVAVKKCNWNGVKGFGLQLSFSDNTVRTVHITAKGAKRIEQLEELKTRLEAYILTSGRAIDVEIIKRRKKASLTLSITST